MVKVAVNIVTFNSAADIGACLDSVQGQTFRDFAIHVLDNASNDDTVDILRGYDLDLIESPSNTGFARAHNDLIRRYDSEFVLILNPDTLLQPDFIANLFMALEARADAASASGKLLRMGGGLPATIDSTGIVMVHGLRHLDRGADEPDLGQYDTPEEIFGPSGAAAFYRVAALKDVAVDGQFFDEDFFVYREDADLAWRCRLMGWRSLYVPAAVAFHRRRVTPERRGTLPAFINYHSVKNRFLLRINNMTAELYRRDFVSITIRDAAVVGYVLLKEWSSVGALLYPVRHFPRLWRKRRRIQGKRRVSGAELVRWFSR